MDTGNDTDPLRAQGMKETSSESPPEPLLGILEMGRLGEVAVHVVAANVQSVIGIPVDVLSPMDPPHNAFQEPRRQYDAGLIIQHLSKLQFPLHLRILALTTVDLCSPILTYVYGEAAMGGNVALVSNYRLRQNEDGKAVPFDLYYERLAKVALHEVAHTFSLYHCDDATCLMHFSPKTPHLDTVEIMFCKRCDYSLRKSIKAEAFKFKHRQK